jgi:hypothetical protein
MYVSGWPSHRALILSPIEYSGPKVIQLPANEKRERQATLA